MHKLALLASVCVALAAGQANAKACYSADEMAADTVLRLHSQLMVVSLSCRTSSLGESLPPIYSRFTQRNLEMIKSSEKRLMDWNRKQGGSGTAKLDKMRTVMGNAYSKEITELSPVGFCAKYRDFAAKADKWSAEELAAELKLVAANKHKGRAALCNTKTAAKETKVKDRTRTASKETKTSIK